MAARLCPYCNNIVEVLLSLPCHTQHRLCRRCLERQIQPLSQSVKCPECRTRTAWIKPELLLVSDGEIPEQQTCSPCRNDDKRGVTAEFFCWDCQHGMCTPCNQMHSQLFKGNTKHSCVCFSEYREKSDLMTRRYCDKADHEGEALVLVCGSCTTKGCLRCGSKACRCEEAQQTLDDYLESKRSNLDEQRKKLQQRANQTASNAKKVQESMEKLRAMSESVVDEINKEHDDIVAILVEVRENKIGKLRNYTKQCAVEVTTYLDRNKDAETELRDLAESLPILLDSTHPAHLVDVFEDVLAVTHRTMDRPADEPLILHDPALVSDSMKVASVVILPLKQKIKYLRNIQLDRGAECDSADVDNDGTLYHADMMPCAIPPDCIRCLNNGDLVTIDETRVTRYVEYVEHVAGAGSARLAQASYFKVNEAKLIRHIVVTDSQVILTSMDDGKVYIHNRFSGEIVTEVSHPQLRRPWGICRNEAGDIYCVDACTGSIFKFHPSDTAVITRICSGLEYLSGIAFHEGLLYVMRDEGEKIFVVTQKGDLLNTLDVPEVKGRARDIRINDDGLVVIANGKRGIQMYQLSPHERLEL